jgi:hypothetical protein
LLDGERARRAAGLLAPGAKPLKLSDQEVIEFIF